MHDWSVTTARAAETVELGRLLGEIIEAPTAVLLSGELGAGKTCFTQGIGLGVGLPADVAVTSPSYTLMNHYSGRLEFYHFDLYRLSDPDELVDLDFDEYICGNGLTVVEWADRFAGLEAEGLRVEIARCDENSRRVRFQAVGEYGKKVLSELARRWREKGRGT